MGRVGAALFALTFGALAWHALAAPADEEASAGAGLSGAAATDSEVCCPATSSDCFAVNSTDECDALLVERAVAVANVGVSARPLAVPDASGRACPHAEHLTEGGDTFRVRVRACRELPMEEAGLSRDEKVLVHARWNDCDLDLIENCASTTTLQVAWADFSGTLLGAMPAMQDPVVGNEFLIRTTTRTGRLAVERAEAIATEAACAR